MTNHEVEVFYDGDCPLCIREINMLKRWDRKGGIQFTEYCQPRVQSRHGGKNIRRIDVPDLWTTS